MLIAPAATVLCALACLVLVLAEWRARPQLRIASKVAASMAFLVVGHHVSGISTFDEWMLVGLVFGAIGDVLLLGHGKRWFMAGLVAFLIGHLAYVVGCVQVIEPTHWLALAGWYAALPIAAGLGALVRLWPRLGGMRVPVVFYVIAIIAMVIGAIAVGRSGLLESPQRTYLVAGAALFFVSDLAVARDRFIAKGFVNRLWGLPAYYAGQLLIAWSIS